mgnify:CR=1 FL=1
MKKSPVPSNVNSNVKKKKSSKKKRRRMRRIRKLLVFLLLAAGLVVFARSSFFIVEKIDVTGNNKYSEKELILKTGLVPGENVFIMLGEKPKNLLKFRFSDLEQQVLNSMPYVKSVSIRPALPTAIKIKVEERTPFAVLEANGKNLLVDREGFVLEVLDNKSSQLKNYFKIIGTSVDSFNLGQAVKLKDGLSFSDISGFCDVVIKNDKNEKLKLYKKITVIDLVDFPYFSVLFDNRIMVKFSDVENADYELSVFRHLFVNNFNEKQKGTLDFTKGSNPYFKPD